MLDLRFYDRTIIHENEERMIYLKKTRNDVVELLPLTSDSLEMLQIRNGESGQKGGRKGKGGRISERRITREAQEHTNTGVKVPTKPNFSSIINCIFF